MSAFCDPVFWLFLSIAALFMLGRAIERHQAAKDQREYLP